MKTAACFWIFVLYAALGLGAQEPGRWPVEGMPEAGARIYQAEGRDFAIALGAERTVFPAGSICREGISLESSGVVHTGAGTILEIQLIPSGALVKVAENTSLSYNGIDENSGFAELGLLYGSIRVVTGTGSVVVRGGGVTVRVDDGDLGVDYVVSPGVRGSTPRPLFRVYAFRGGAEVFPYGRDGSDAFFGGARLLSVGAGESLSLDVAPPYTYAERKPLDRELSGYWMENNFSGSSPLPMPDTRITETEEAPVPVYLPAPPFSPPASVTAPAPNLGPVEPAVPQQSVTGNRRKNFVLALGLSLIAGSVGVQVVSHQQALSGNKTAELFYNGAYGTLGVGAVITLAGIIFNPPSSAK
jgi:hypothetical protein